MRLQSSIGYQTVYANVPDGSYASSSCANGYNLAYIWDETGKYQVHVCIPAPKPAPAPVVQPPPVYNNYNTVTPNIQVSPQISPVFQQQFQPNNSPATAGTSQTNAPVAPAGTSQTNAPVAPAGPPRIVELSSPPLTAPTNTPEAVQPTQQNNTPAPAPYIPAPAASGYAVESDTQKVLQAATGQNAPAQNSLGLSNKTVLIGAGAAVILAIILLSNKRK